MASRSQRQSKAGRYRVVLSVAPVTHHDLSRTAAERLAGSLAQKIAKGDLRTGVLARPTSVRIVPEAAS